MEVTELNELDTSEESDELTEFKLCVSIELVGDETTLTPRSKLVTALNIISFVVITTGPMSMYDVFLS